VYYDIRIEPKKTITTSEVKRRVSEAFNDVGLTEEGVQIINID
jgi:hypothetical protein